MLGSLLSHVFTIFFLQVIIDLPLHYFNHITTFALN
jgi:hypothetical protein